MHGANSTEFDPDTPTRSSSCCPSSRTSRTWAARCGSAPSPSSCASGTRAHDAYGETLVYERHRHRYEVNNHLRPRLEAAGLRVSGVFAAKDLVEVIELRGPSRGSSPRSSTPSSSRARRGRSRSSATSSGAAIARVAVRGPRAHGMTDGGRGRGALGLFLELAAISSPSGDERAVVDVCIAYLRDLGLEPAEDDAAAAARRRGRQPLSAASLPRRARRGTPIFLCAHVDTVEPTAPIDPVVQRRRRHATRDDDDPRRRQQGDRRRDARRPSADRRGAGTPHAGIELVLSAQEEIGLHGVKAFDARSACTRASATSTTTPRRSAASCTAAPCQYSIDARFLGRAAHAGIAPEEGRNAIAAARARDRRDAASAGSTTRRPRTSGRSRRRRPQHRGRPLRRAGSRCARATTSAALRESQTMLDAIAHAANAAELRARDGDDPRVPRVPAAPLRSRRRRSRERRSCDCGYVPRLLAHRRRRRLARLQRARASRASTSANGMGRSTPPTSASRWPMSRRWSASRWRLCEARPRRRVDPASRATLAPGRRSGIA